jgi:uncharacterized protein VirK/YbjX
VKEDNSRSAAAPAGTPELLRLIVAAAREIHPGFSPATVKRKLFFVCRAFGSRALLREFYARMTAVSTDGGAAASRDVVGVTEWPYLNNAWTVADRLDRIATHYEVLASMPRGLRTVAGHDALRLVDLSKFSDACAVVIDRASWFKREGELVLNLFKENLRVLSMPFIFGIQDGATTIFIGAIQGIHKGVSARDSLEIFKNLTKDFEGLRPRSLLLDILRMIGNALHVQRLLAVADENRHHRHEYFGPLEPAKLGANYNETWIEHGGIPSAVQGFYELPVQALRKEPVDIPSRKRAMYRRRYTILAEIEQEVANKLG